MNFQKIGQSFVEKGYVIDSITRFAIRRLLAQRLREIEANNAQRAAEQEEAFLLNMQTARIAEETEKANSQHYEVPSEFFSTVLGPHRKYSCGFFDSKSQSLQDAEENALAQTCQNADLHDDQRVLELGCGWGSLSLYMAQRYPKSRFTVVSNSHSQGKFIRTQLACRDLNNVTVVTDDMNTFETQAHFDRIVSVEMFEHMRNWQELLAKVTKWLQPDGRFFMHIFVHRSTPYLYEDKDESDWMSRHFFSGGIMPSIHLPLRFTQHVCLEKKWVWPGHHYQRTCNAWLRNMDKNKTALMPLFYTTYGKENATIWWQRWRLFFMACAELFAYKNGQEWMVAHYRFKQANA